MSQRSYGMEASINEEFIMDSIKTHGFIAFNVL